MTLAELMAGDGATTGCNGAYGQPGGTTLLNFTTTLNNGYLLIEVFQVTLIDGAWVPQNGDLSVYTVLSDGRILTDSDNTLDANGNNLAIQRYRLPCLFGDAVNTTTTTWESSVAGGGEWDWTGSGDTAVDNGNYYFQVQSSFDAEIQNGNIFQQYGDTTPGGSGGTENIRTWFVNGICTEYASQSNGGAVFHPVRVGNRV